MLDMTYDEYMESWNSMKLAVVATADGQAGGEADAGTVGK